MATGNPLDVSAHEATRRLRVLVGKPGLDGHDRGARVVASALRDAGMEVIYTGLRATPELIVATALQESVDVIGLSVLSGAHISIAERTLALLQARGLPVPILMGGVIPQKDRARLKEMGIAAVFGQEASLEEIVAAVRQLASSGSSVAAPEGSQGEAQRNPAQHLKKEAP